MKIWYRFVHHKDAVKTCYALLLLTKLKPKDEYTAEHSLNVSILSAAFGKRLGLLEAEIRTLGLCGLLHDIGKTRVPLEILQKSGELTP